MKITIDWHVGQHTSKWSAHAPGGWLVCEGEERTLPVDTLKRWAEVGVREAYERHPLGSAPAECLTFEHQGLEELTPRPR